MIRLVKECFLEREEYSKINLMCLVKEYKKCYHKQKEYPNHKCKNRSPINLVRLHKNILKTIYKVHFFQMSKKNKTHNLLTSPLPNKFQDNNNIGNYLQQKNPPQLESINQIIIKFKSIFNFIIIEKTQHSLGYEIITQKT